MADKAIRIFACEAQPVVTEGLRSALEEYAGIEFAGAAVGPAETLAAISNDPPEIVLIDHDDDPRAAASLIGRLSGGSMGSQPVLWARDLTDVDLMRALQLGVRGVIAKTHPVGELIQCFRTVAAGGLWIDETFAQDLPVRPDRRAAPRLTPRERQIVELVARGLKNTQIARELAISPGTVKVHLMHVFEKTGAQDRFELAVRSRKLLTSDTASREPVAAAGGPE